ncbi:MAG TPA: nucleotide exchange factor GrpE [bacterium]|nr:nucleotide exchange factor GrpE [bacterium]
MTEPTDKQNDRDDEPQGEPQAGPKTGAIGEPPTEIPPCDAEITRLREECAQLELKLQRALADTQNIRRRQQKELEEGRRRTLEGLTQELLPVLDTFALALQAYDGGGDDGQQKAGDTDALVEGVRMVRTLLTGALERHGLSEIPALGQPFDPARHEALGVEPSDAVEDNHVLRVVQTGYQLGDHVVRHSKVIVAGPKQSEGDD